MKTPSIKPADNTALGFCSSHGTKCFQKPSEILSHIYTKERCSYRIYVVMSPLSGTLFSLGCSHCEHHHQIQKANIITLQFGALSCWNLPLEKWNTVVINAGHGQQNMKEIGAKWLKISYSQLYCRNRAVWVFIYHVLCIYKMIRLFKIVFS